MAVVRLWWRRPVVGLRLGLAVVAALRIPLVLCVADDTAPDSTCCCADGCTFKTATTLMSDNAADSCTAECAEYCACLCIRARCAGAESDEKG